MKKERFQELIAKYGRQTGDSGSSEVQVAILTERIIELTDHLRYHKKDHSTRRGLLALVSQRRHLLDYLGRTDLEKYNRIVGDYKIRHQR